MDRRVFEILEFNKILEKLENFCVSERAKYRAMNLRFFKKKDKIEKLQLETKQAFDFIIKSLDFKVGIIYEIKPFIDLSLKDAILYNDEILKIYDTLRTAKKVKSSILKFEYKELIDILIKESEKISIFKNFENLVEKIVKSSTEIYDDASVNLFNIREKIKIKNDEIKEKLDKIIINNRQYLQDTIIAYRDSHYTLAIKQEHKNRIKGIIFDESSSGQTVYIEPIEIVNITNEITKLKLEEKKEIEYLLKQITNIVKENSVLILDTYFALINIDFMIAKANLAIDMNATNVEISDNKYINLKKARHPLIDKKNVVAIDFYLGNDFNSLLITGPNTGGKTVTLKTVGIFVLMFQSGLHLPCNSGSTMPIFDKVFVDIGDEQSIEQNLSTFSSHMKNIVYILNNFNENSLCLFDELGAGTDPIEGAALAISILNYIYKKGALSVATTHYSELKKYALFTKGFKNAAVEFDVETLSPTYKLSIGAIGKSNAFAISEKLGLNEEIIKNSKDFIESSDIQFEDIVKELEDDKKQISKYKYESERLLKELEKQKKEFELEKQKFDENIKDKLDKAKIKAKDIIREAKYESEELLKQLKKEEKVFNYKKKFTELEKKNNVVFEKKEIKGDIPKNLRIGETVIVASLNKEANVITLPDNKNNLFVQIGIVRYPVNIEDLRVIEEKNSINVNLKNNIYKRNGGKMLQNVSSLRVNSRKDASIEIDLRGKNVDEARIELDKYFDNAFLSGYKTVTVIHGVGTGALKEGLKSFIRNHKHVKEAREGIFGEGGAGVTVVTLI